MEPRGALVDLLPARGQPGLEREVLAEAQQRIEGQMRELERGARQLLVRVERGWVCVIGHAQRLGLGGGENAAKGEKRGEQQQTPKHGLTWPCAIGSKLEPAALPWINRFARLFRHRHRYRCRQDAGLGVADDPSRCRLLEAGAGWNRARDRLRDRAQARRNFSEPYPARSLCPARGDGAT